MNKHRIVRPSSSLLACLLVLMSRAVPALAATPDYAGATWIAASPANYSTADRPHDYVFDMIVIHDTEEPFASAITDFQDPARQASAHYVVSQTGQVDQMVQEHDIAWHAGNWDYNTRSIGIEHEGYAWTPYTFTNAEYDASAHLAASICSRWGVPMDRNHVIGHDEVPDPSNPTLFGGSDHHTDPGPYWNWSLYMQLASGYANALPSPPHMVLEATATAANASATVAWPAARTCHAPILSYHVSGQPGNISVDVPASVTSATITGLQNGTTYTFTVTAINSDGQDSLTANPVTPYTTPASPRNVAATAGDRSATVTWTAPNDGGRPIIGYRITPYINGRALPTVAFSRTGTMEVISGLSDDVSYSFVVVAVNVAGLGAPSPASNLVLPSASFNPAAQQAGAAGSPPPRSGTAQSSPAPTPPPR